MVIIARTTRGWSRYWRNVRKIRAVTGQQLFAAMPPITSHTFGCQASRCSVTPRTRHVDNTVIEHQSRAYVCSSGIYTTRTVIRTPPSYLPPIVHRITPAHAPGRVGKAEHMSSLVVREQQREPRWAVRWEGKVGG